jgi:hypothetical protein
MHAEHKPYCSRKGEIRKETAFFFQQAVLTTRRGRGWHCREIKLKRIET